MLLASERRALVEHARRLRADGLVVGTAGNLSTRVGDLVAVTPSGLDYDALTPELVCVVGLDGDSVERKVVPSLELPMHLAVYRETEAVAVVHTHSPYATAVGTVVEKLPAVHYLIADLGGPVSVAPYATPGSEELAQALVQALEGRSAALMRNHGAVAIGDSLERAYGRAVTLEWLAALYWRARLIGEPSLVGDDELARLAELVKTYGRR